MARRFRKYVQLVNDKLVPRFNATWHWAKLEVPQGQRELAAVKSRLAARYPLSRFNEYRRALDPSGMMANGWVDALLGTAGAAPAAAAK